MPDWFFTSDLHGQQDFYEQLLAEVAPRPPRAVLIGGDLGPHATGPEGILRQRLFLEGFLVEFARRLHEVVADVKLLLLLGNDDWAANADVLERHHGDLWSAMHERVVEVDGIPVAGLSWVPITPFALKDWERWEDGEPEAPPRLGGWTSANGPLREHVFDPARRSPTIAGALASLARQCEPARTIFLLHSPPRDTLCDVVQSRQHVGSRAIRAFLEQHQPPLALSGHIHESPQASGAWRDRVGRTVVVNPGQFGKARLCGVWFDPERPDETLRHTTRA